MAIRDIIEHPDPRLRQVCAAVETFDGAVQGLIADLFDTLATGSAIGLSAPQLGELKRVLVVHVPGDAYGAQAYINPELLSSAARGIVEESCLSVPGVSGNVIRPTRVRVRAADSSGVIFERDLDGMHAVCLQHEMDHLEGRLFIDRLSWFKKLRMRLGSARSTAGATDSHAA